MKNVKDKILKSTEIVLDSVILPTAIRKSTGDTLYEYPISTLTSQFFMMSGILSSCYTIEHIVGEYSRSSSFEEAVIRIGSFYIASNVLSGTYELGRWKGIKNYRKKQTKTVERKKLENNLTLYKEDRNLLRTKQPEYLDTKSTDKLVE